MKLRPVGPAEIFHRVLSPRWAIAPLSAAGAAKGGGHFNRPGTPALYFSRAQNTAIAEYRQDTALMPPGTLVAYRITLTHVVDFSGGYAAGEWEPLWEEWDRNWRELWARDHIEPPSWLMGEAVLAAGAKGLLFPSTKDRAGTNPVVFTDALDPEDRIEPHDPAGDLPRDQSSWRLPPNDEARSERMSPPRL